MKLSRNAKFVWFHDKIFKKIDVSRVIKEILVEMKWELISSIFLSNYSKKFKDRN